MNDEKACDDLQDETIRIHGYGWRQFGEPWCAVELISASLAGVFMIYFVVFLARINRLF
jgi:hypothetical protein